MRRIFTFSFIAIALSLVSFNSFGQGCTPNATFTTSYSNNFATGLQGFQSTDFSPSGGGVITSTNVGAGSTKVLTTITLFQPASQPIVAWGFTLSGSANVNSYTVIARYSNGTSIQTVNVCSGTTIANGARTFSATAPTQIVGHSFQLEITFTVSGGNGNTLSLDNFISNVGQANSPLPVKFQNFQATPSNNSVSLKWAVGTEDNVSGYEIEKSFDARNFSKLGFVNATNQSSYTFVDSKSAGTVYYRIKSIDLDGKYGFSTIAMVKAGQALTLLNAYPSPFVNSFSLDHSTAAAGSLITINTEDGRTIKTIIPTAGSQRTTVDLSSAKAGLYLVRYKNSNGQVETLKILKQL